MEIIPVTFATICIPTGMLLIVNNTERNQVLFWSGMAFIVLGVAAIFWANWLVYQKRKEEIQKNAEERLMRVQEMQLLEEMLSQLKELRKSSGE